MADIKISDLQNTTMASDGSDLFEISQDQNGGGYLSKNVSAAQIGNFVNAAQTYSGLGGLTPVAAISAKPDDLADLGDVDIDGLTLADGDVLVWNSTGGTSGNGGWENKSITAGDIEYSSGVSVGDVIDELGTMYSAAWTASTSSSLSRLTASATLGTKGLYLITVIVPNSSGSIAFGFRVEGWGIVQKYGQQNSLGAMTFPFEAAYDNLQIYLDSQQSAAVTFSNLERGGLYAVKIK